jgi:hypothetical protein
MARVARESGVAHALDRGVLGEALGDDLSTGLGAGAA